MEKYKQFFNESKVSQLTQYERRPKIINKIEKNFKDYLSLQDIQMIEEINKYWKQYSLKLSKDIIEYVKILTQGKYFQIYASINKEWEYDYPDKEEFESDPNIEVYLPDFTIYVTFKDDVDASKYYKKLEGLPNSISLTKDIKLIDGNKKFFTFKKFFTLQTIEISSFMELLIKF